MGDSPKGSPKVFGPGLDPLGGLPLVRETAATHDDDAGAATEDAEPVHHDGDDAAAADDDDDHGDALMAEPDSPLAERAH